MCLHRMYLHVMRTAIHSYFLVAGHCITRHLTEADITIHDKVLGIDSLTRNQTHRTQPSLWMIASGMLIAQILLTQCPGQISIPMTSALRRSPVGAQVGLARSCTYLRNHPVGRILTISCSSILATNMIIIRVGVISPILKQSQTLAYWLAADPNHVLMVLAGEYTADYAHPVNGYAHAGIQNVLFPAIRDYPIIGTRNIRTQAIVCNYDHTNHEDMWKQFRDKMNDPNHTACPGSPDAVWNP